MIHPSTSSKRNLPVIYSAEDQYCIGKYGVKYLDFIGGNNTIILGHKKYNFRHTPNFSGKSYLEDKVSETLSHYTKSQHFRYFKNGTDAVSCALRLSRYLLKRYTPTIGFIGYGGSNNEYVYTFNHKGIPYQKSFQITNETSCDILVYESRFEEKAAKIKADFKICDHLKSGINGLTEPMADIDLYGKSIANGYPIAIMTGYDDIMEKIDKIYYSTTFGGENVGLESVLLTLKEFEIEKPRYETLKRYANKTLPKWGSISEKQIKAFSDKQILFNGYWQIMTCHTKTDIDTLKKAIDDIM
jgi:glutamate-1-semialdehyde aminotransferase